MNMNTDNRKLLTIVVVILVIFAAYAMLTMPDRRTDSERLGDAIGELPNLDRATEQLEKRTPGEKLGDAVKDVGDDIKEKTGD